MAVEDRLTTGGRIEESPASGGMTQAEFCRAISQPAAARVCRRRFAIPSAAIGCIRPCVGGRDRRTGPRPRARAVDTLLCVARI